MSGSDFGMNIILVGFMGTGKSTVSRLLSERLGWECLDTDEVIGRLAGKSIPQIFAEDGETAFRDWESEAVREALNAERRIVATGGGAVLRESNRLQMLERGRVVALTADKASLIRRVTSAAEGTRPLLAGDAEARVSQLLESRRHAYDFAHARVDTTDKSPEEVAEELLRGLPEGWL
ncbi:shikimate kinase [Cohnella sp. SGD-V74]|uniref:shikimate kinase n=1 Tax=unclassified Cohnella TaxID=2636738 RepID=UPI000D4D148F|nr:shikimate kinase [Cohnella sp. SGD-V74]